MEQQRLRTREEVISDFNRRGQSIQGWAKDNGLRPRIVRDVLSGRLIGRIGASHKAAVLLGIKDGEIVEGVNHA